MEKVLRYTSIHLKIIFPSRLPCVQAVCWKDLPGFMAQVHGSPHNWKSVTGPRGTPCHAFFELCPSNVAGMETVVVLWLLYSALLSKRVSARVHNCEDDNKFWFDAIKNPERKSVH